MKYASWKMRPILAVCTLALTLVSHAGLVTDFDDIDYWVGSGTNEAAMVIQWNDGNSPQSIAWGFRWSDTDTPTVQDMLFALAGSITVSPGAPQPPWGADVRLGLDLGYSTSFGYFLNGASYNQLGLGGDFTSTIRNESGFSLDGESWTLYELGVTSAWPTGAVMPADFGMSSLTLAEGGWYGWSYTSAFPPPEYSPVAFTFTQPFAAAVPEPGTLWLLLGAGGAILWLRVKRRETRRG